MKTVDMNHPCLQQSPFKVPEGYFAEFTEKFMQRVALSVAPRGRELPFVRWMPLVGAACVLLLVVLFSQSFPQKSVEKDIVAAEGTLPNSMSTEDEVYDYVMTANAKNTEIYDMDF